MILNIDVNLKFKLHDKEYDLTETEARALMARLKGIFGDNNYYHYSCPHFDIIPLTIPYQPYPYTATPDITYNTNTQTESSL